MKKLLLLAVGTFMMVVLANAQRYAIIDTKYILDKLPDYKIAQKKLDDIAKGWQREEMKSRVVLIFY